MNTYTETTYTATNDYALGEYNITLSKNIPTSLTIARYHVLPGQNGIQATTQAQTILIETVLQNICQNTEKKTEAYFKDTCESGYTAGVKQLWVGNENCNGNDMKIVTGPLVGNSNTGTYACTQGSGFVAGHIRHHSSGCNDDVVDNYIPITNACNAKMFHSQEQWFRQSTFYDNLDDTDFDVSPLPPPITISDA